MKKNKIVYNSCYGGFSLSKEAIILGRKLSGDNRWAGVLLAGEEYKNGEKCEFFYGSIEYDFPRHDKVLVDVVEKLGENASGTCSDLDIFIIEGNQYRIDEYDGLESVVEPNVEEWVFIE